MYSDLTLAALYGVVTVVLFLYGAAQRHLRASVLRAIDLERAKAENSVVRAQENAEAAARAEGAAAERAAVVEWLRGNPGISRAPECITAMTLFECADAIEAGMHAEGE